MNVRNERILILGDSLSALPPYTTTKATIIDVTPSTNAGSPGGILGKLLLADGAQAVRVNARVGRSAISFIQGENGVSLIANDVSQFRPTKIIVFLGTNDIDRGLTTDALTRTSTAMREIRDAFAHAEIIALGPPSYPNAKYQVAAPTMLKTIQNVFGVDHTIDIRPFTGTAQRTGDGIHFTAAGAQDAAPEIAAAITTVGQLVPTTATSTGVKIAWGVAGVAGFVGATLLALYIAKRAARNPRGFALNVGRTALRYALKAR